MPFLIAAVVALSALGVLNLAFSLAVVRRLREHTELLSKMPAGSGGGAGDGVLAAGEHVADFTGRTIDGTTLTRQSLAPDSVVGFFSPTCQPCKERVPEFVGYAGAHPDGRARAYAVVIGKADETAGMVTTLSAVATVLTGEDCEAMVQAFGVEGYPAFYHLGAGAVVAASGHGMSVLPQLAVA
jgi:hypothetical protein